MKTNLFLEMIFPRRCTVCDRVLPWGEKEICVDCKKKIQYSSGPLCFKCGKPVKDEEEYCYDCRKKEHYFKQGAALFPYEYIRLSLYRFKYGGRQEYAGFYGRQMAYRLEEKRRQWKPEALVPVPLHKWKQKKRGYNQAELIARELSGYWKIPVITNLVVRCKNTRPMKEIVGTDRQNNLKKAFKLGTNDVKLNTIIIIDDIYTTGSTIDAVSKVCLEAGITNVYFMTVSIGYGL